MGDILQLRPTVRSADGALRKLFLVGGKLDRLLGLLYHDLKKETA